MSTTTWAAVPLALALCLSAGSASARAPAPEIVVTASPRAVALNDWSQRVRRDLESRMRTSSRIADTSAEGLVAVGFRCTESGRPDGVTIVQSSGNPTLDRMAVHSVRRLTSLHPTVEGMRPNQKVLAQLLYVNGYGVRSDADARVKDLAAKARADNGWFTRDEIASGEVLLVGAAY